jgi:hypothetical protein
MTEPAEPVIDRLLSVEEAADMLKVSAYRIAEQEEPAR